MKDRRASILDAAARLIAARGFTPTSIDDVIREAGLSGKSHFYHYFKSKEQLGYEVLARQFDRFAERGLAVLREPMIDPLERLSLFIDSLVALQVERGCKGGSPFGSLAAEMADAHEGFRARIEVVFERWATQIQSLLWEARPQLADDTDGGRLARFIIATLEGALLMSRVHRDPAVLEGIAADLKRFIATHVQGDAARLALAGQGTIGSGAPAQQQQQQQQQQARGNSERVAPDSNAAPVTPVTAARTRGGRTRAGVVAR